MIVVSLKSHVVKFLERCFEVGTYWQGINRFYSVTNIFGCIVLVSFDEKLVAKPLSLTGSQLADDLRLSLQRLRGFRGSWALPFSYDFMKSMALQVIRTEQAKNLQYQGYFRINTLGG